MSDSQVIARKFRPQTFEKVVGQEAITRTLANSIASSRIHHAYLFTGARGVGKTTTARILAKCLNCAKGITAEPCGVCASCQDIAASRSIDVLEIDAASNTGVDNVREVIINSIANSSPPRDRYRLFIIDEVHMLSNAAFNALLKTLEEPPPRVVFIMATTELQKVPETILSRCQVFEFRTITLKKIADQLRHIADSEGVKISDTALLAISRAGDGSMRDAESALDQVISFAGNNIADEDVSAALGLVDVETLNETMRAVAEQDSGRLLRIVDEVVTRGYDLRNFCRELMVHIRALLVVKVAGFDAELVQMAASDSQSLVKLSEAFSEQDLMRFFSILTKTEQDIRLSTQPRFQLEIGLMKLAHARRLYLLEDAMSQLADIQSRLGGAGVSSQGGAGSSTPSTGSGKAGPQFGSGASRSTARASAESIAGPPRSTEPERIPAPPLDEMPNPFAAASKRADTTTASTRAVTHAPEPPPMLDEPYEPEHDSSQAGEERFDGHEAVDRIKKAIESRRKMMLLSHLDLAHSIEIDGGFFRVVYAPENAVFKNQVDSKDNRKLIEEISREVLKRKLTLSVSVIGQAAKVESIPKETPLKQKPKAEDDPRINALKEKFRGEVIEVKGRPN